MVKLHIIDLVWCFGLEPLVHNSEFFICVGDQPDLDFGGMRNPDGQGFAAFGRVVRGMDVVRRIGKEPTTTRGFHQNVPATPVIIQSARQLPEKAGK